MGSPKYLSSDWWASSTWVHLKASSECLIGRARLSDWLMASSQNRRALLARPTWSLGTPAAERTAAVQARGLSKQHRHCGSRPTVRRAGTCRTRLQRARRSRRELCHSSNGVVAAAAAAAGGVRGVILHPAWEPRPLGVVYNGTVYRLESLARRAQLLMHMPVISLPIIAIRGSGTGSVCGATSPDTAFAEV
jgi:hypothetical protein